jgi:TRAP-type mannitol/chloroaromatic compound transport system substrate-binding protein
MPNIATADGLMLTVLKMQAAWPSGANIFFEMAGDYCNMVEEMSGGSLTIDLQPVGAVVKTSEIGASSKCRRSLDMGHWVTAYWYGKNAAASLFGTGPSYGMSSQEVMGWMEYGGGRALYEEAVKSVGFNYTVSSICLCQLNHLVGLKRM